MGLGGIGTLNPNGTAEFIDKTYAEAAAMQAASQFEPGTTYKITDRGDGGLFLTALTANKLSAEGWRMMLVPNYAVAGNYKGQWTSGTVIANNEIYVWGGTYWQNNTGGNVTPAPANDITLNGTLTQLAKTIANGYQQLPCEVRYDFDADVITWQASAPNGAWSGSTTAPTLPGYQPLEYLNWSAGQQYQLWLGAVLNNKNLGTLSNIQVAWGGICRRNSVDPGTTITNVQVGSGAIFENNTAAGTSTQTDIVLAGKGDYYSGVASKGTSTIQRIDISGGGSLQTVSVTNKTISDLTITACSIASITDINVVECAFSQQGHDFTGWTRDLNNEQIVDGRGQSYKVIDFAVTPLLVGTPQFHNYVPQGGRLTRIVAVANTLASPGAAELAIGLETDDAAFVPAQVLATYNAGPVSSAGGAISNAATAARSIVLTATVANITSGTIKVWTDFITNGN